AHTRMLSEAPFVTFVIATLLLLANYIHRPRRLPIILAGCCIAAASLTRWSGISLIPAAVAAVSLASSRIRLSRAIDTILLLVIITAAMEAWTMYNHQPFS